MPIQTFPLDTHSQCLPTHHILSNSSLCNQQDFYRIERKSKRQGEWLSCSPFSCNSSPLISLSSHNAVSRVQTVWQAYSHMPLISNKNFKMKTSMYHGQISLANASILQRPACSCITRSSNGLIGAAQHSMGCGCPLEATGCNTLSLIY